MYLEPEAFNTKERFRCWGRGVPHRREGSMRSLVSSCCLLHSASIEPPPMPRESHEATKRRGEETGRGREGWREKGDRTGDEGMRVEDIRELESAADAASVRMRSCGRVRCKCREMGVCC